MALAGKPDRFLLDSARKRGETHLSLPKQNQKDSELGRASRVVSHFCPLMSRLALRHRYIKHPVGGDVCGVIRTQCCGPFNLRLATKLSPAPETSLFGYGMKSWGDSDEANESSGNVVIAMSRK
jgi:hypothetical protein